MDATAGGRWPMSNVPCPLAGNPSLERWQVLIGINLIISSPDPRIFSVFEWLRVRSADQLCWVHDNFADVRFWLKITLWGAQCSTGRVFPFYRNKEHNSWWINLNANLLPKQGPWIREPLCVKWSSLERVKNNCIYASDRLIINMALR